MMGVRHLLPLVVLFFSGPVCENIQFLKRRVGDTVVFPCLVDEEHTPFGLHLKRRWLNPGEVMYMDSKEEPIIDSDYNNRVFVSGDPSSRQLNITISPLVSNDTDHYYCEFFLDNLTVFRNVPGKVDFYLHVADDDPGSMDIVHVETCSGGSAVLPCFPPHGETGPAEGVVLKRKKNQGPMEVLYHSKHHQHTSSSPTSSFLPLERLKLVAVPGPGGMGFTLTLLLLQAEDSGFYSCQLLLHSWPDSRASLGAHVFYVAVQGEKCSCSSYSILLYAMFSAVSVLLVLLIGLAIICQVKVSARSHVKPQALAPIYEEMVGVRSPGSKLAPRGLHLEEADTSAYCVSSDKPRPENHYESPGVAYSPVGDGNI